MEPINDSVTMYVGQKEIKIRVTESEGKIFHPYVRSTELREVVDQEQEQGSEKVIESSESEMESSEELSDEEDVESCGESFVKDSSPEEHVKKSMIWSNDVFEAMRGEEECRMRNILENNNREIEKENIKTSEPTVDTISRIEIKSPNKDILNRIEIKSPNKENQDVGAQLNTSFEVDPKKADNIPESLIGVSDRLKELLSTSTPIKGKIKNAGTDNSRDEQENRETLDTTDGQAKADNQVQSSRKKEECKLFWEKRLTRSQTRKTRSEDKGEESISSGETSSNYLQGMEDSDQRILEVGTKCGIFKGNGRGRGRKSSAKKGEVTGKQ
ncbi:hypothetical protein L2E82_17395 [Cichorium intybus]|uniref:Uncharacterized protein n=1 Tax=Cichorium intybus TaxID=13427 RepID=A0ACB9F925_CICIN|nr:hypothetical protein L2E82_17395 [Cichorium intybus]